VTVEVTEWKDVPARPGVYALYDREPGKTDPAYVGITGNLRTRLVQHFVRRDSSVVTGTSAAGLNIDRVRYVAWWESEDFADNEKRHAAELVAFDELKPTLRSRGTVPEGALAYYRDAGFCTAEAARFRGEPTGRLRLPALAEVAQQVLHLQERVAALEALVKKKLS
jgi:hypothetical protein